MNSIQIIDLFNTRVKPDLAQAIRSCVAATPDGNVRVELMRCLIVSTAKDIHSVVAPNTPENEFLLSFFQDVVTAYEKHIRNQKLIDGLKEEK